MFFEKTELPLASNHMVNREMSIGALRSLIICDETLATSFLTLKGAPRMSERGRSLLINHNGFLTGKTVDGEARIGHAEMSCVGALNFRLSPPDTFFLSPAVPQTLSVKPS
jgi:hypothetical protein